jgi:hypothetical protein
MGKGRKRGNGEMRYFRSRPVSRGADVSRSIYLQLGINQHFLGDLVSDPELDAAFLGMRGLRE